MTPLRKRMVEEMKLRNFAPKTIDLYVDNVAKFAKSPELLGEEQVRKYLVHLLEERKLAWGTYNQARWVLQRGDIVRDSRGPRRVRHLPVVLSLDEVRRFFAAVISYKHRMVLMPAPVPPHKLMSVRGHLNLQLWAGPNHQQWRGHQRPDAIRHDPAR